MQLEEGKTPLRSIYQAASVRETFSMLEVFAAPHSESIDDRLLLSRTAMSTS